MQDVNAVSDITVGADTAMQDENEDDLSDDGKPLFTNYSSIRARWQSFISASWGSAALKVLGRSRVSPSRFLGILFYRKPLHMDTPTRS